eukprot:470617-Pyramimonas_sp.AAC.1
MFSLSSSSGPASDETCSARGKDGRRAYQHARVHAIAGLPREHHGLRLRRQQLHSDVGSQSRCAGRPSPLESSLDRRYYSGGPATS